MPNGRIADLFRVRERFLRSVNLERDFRNADALRGYVITPHGRSGLNRLASGLVPESGQRAWRITGDYGSGKSSFALALAHLFSGRDRLPEQLRSVVDFRRVGGRPNLLPILVTGSRAPLTVSLVTALRRALEDIGGRGKPPKVLEQARALEDSAAKKLPSDNRVLELLTDTGDYLTSTSKASGLLIILDELGKFLEFAAMNPTRQDIFFLQALAEAATQNRQSSFFVIGILHQGFNVYANQLAEHAQREWEKVAGRFEELLFDQPLEQTSSLVADALGVRVEALPSAVVRQARDDMDSTIAMGWYGPAAAAKTLRDLAPRLYPLHPTVLPILARLFHRFGQNERSLFSFLFSSEPNGLRAFAEQAITTAGFYRIHHLYDYSRACFGQRLSVQSYRSHWNHIESVVESFPLDGSTDIQVLKTIGILNLLDTQPLLASERAVELSVNLRDTARRDEAKHTLRRLQKEKRIIHFRGTAGGYCLWPHTSVDLDKAYRDAERAISPATRVASLIVNSTDPRPLVARRHYIKTGNLRYFRVRYAAVSELAKCIQEPFGQADGMILVALCETQQEHDDAVSLARDPSLAKRTDLLVAVPAPLSSLRGLIQETQRWEWVATNVPELGNDRYAAEEVSRQVAASRRTLDDRVQSFIGLRRATSQNELKWFRANQTVKIKDGRDLLVNLSGFFDEMFPNAPRVRNELLNRHDLSSAAAGARMRLIERLLSFPTLPLLGMDKEKKPPEMSMYLSVLKHGGLHKETPRGYDVVEPGANEDPLNLLPSLQRILELLSTNADGRVRVNRVFEELARPPYGVRAGLAPLLLAAFAAIHEQEVAFYSLDAFVRRISGQDFMRLVKAPETFEIQFCKITGVRAILFAQLAALFNAERPEQRTDSLLDVVRTLCLFAAQLPSFTLKTRRLPATAIAVRDALVAAKEPSTLVFRDLPRACGFEPFQSDAITSEDVVESFVAALKSALEELKAAYPELHQRMKMDIATVFEAPGSFDEVRAHLATTSLRMLHTVSEPRLKAFCLRLADSKLPEVEWLESLGSFICEKPPSKWLDIDSDHFREELHRVGRQYRRVEATAFETGSGTSVRVSVTLPDGSEAEQVVHLTAEEDVLVASFEGEIASLVSRSRRVGMAAAARVLWKEMQKS